MRAMSFSSHFTEKLGSKLRARTMGAFAETTPEPAAQLAIEARAPNEA